MTSIRSICFVLVNILASIQVPSVTGKIILPPGCDEQQLCFKKPENYPQEEIDEYFMKNGVKFTSPKDDVVMRTTEYEVFDDSIGCVTIERHEKAFTYRGNAVIQSPYLTQEIKHVICGDYGSSCWEDILKSEIYSATCEPKQSKITVIVFDNKEKKPVPLVVPVDIGCSCIIKDKRKMMK